MTLTSSLQLTPINKLTPLIISAYIIIQSYLSWSFSSLHISQSTDLPEPPLSEFWSFWFFVLFFCMFNSVLQWILCCILGKHWSLTQVSWLQPKGSWGDFVKVFLLGDCQHSGEDVGQIQYSWLLAAGGSGLTPDAWHRVRHHTLTAQQHIKKGQQGKNAKDAWRTVQLFRSLSMPQIAFVDLLICDVICLRWKCMHILLWNLLCQLLKGNVLQVNVLGLPKAKIISGFCTRNKFLSEYYFFTHMDSVY